MKQQFASYKMTALLCLLSIAYGWYYLIPRTREMVHWQPPEIYILSWAMIVISIFCMLTIALNNRKFIGYSTIFIAICWAVVSWRYYITPFPNSNAILSLGYVGICLITLLRGDYTNGKV